MNVIHEYIWFVLGGAAFIAFILGLIIRGMMSAGKTRRATVERDVAITELEQVRGELDSLYAAQRKQREEAAAAANAQPSREELKARDERLAQLSTELENAQAQLVALREARSEPAETAAPAVNEEAEELKSRNAYLEERVGELEARIHEMSQAAPAAAEPVEPPSTDDAGEAAKKDWQIDFLKSRVASLEEKLLEVEKADAEAVAAPADKAADEELARLRWRNRYLEGRLAYFEEAPAEETVTEDNIEPASPEVAEELAEVAELQPVEPAPAPEVVDTAGEGTERAVESEHPSEKMLRALDGGAEGAADEAQAEDTGDGAHAANDDEQQAPTIDGVAPPKQEQPDGAPDDLTLISGVGPRIQTILNDLGIWHFTQIANWSPENEAWVDDQLNFAGRVGREGWVTQARELVAANEKSN